MIVSPVQAGTDGREAGQPNRAIGSRALALIILLVICASCSQHRSGSPVLASFDRLEPRFQQIDAVAHQVAVDVQALNSSMQADNVAEARRRADSLAIHATRLSTLATRARTMIHSLARHERNGVVMSYFRTLLRVLGQQWAEGETLQQLAHLTWGDPLITTAPDEQRLSGLVSAARQHARQAVTLAARASAWRSRHKQAFRYSAPEHTT